MNDAQICTRSLSQRFRHGGFALTAFAVLFSSLTLAASSAGGAVVNQRTLVSAVPASFTPDVNNGDVLAVAQVGTQMILGGTFTSVSPANTLGTTYPLVRLVSFNATTGVIDHTGFRPTVNGKVDTMVAGPSPHEVYIGGAFTTVDGRHMSIALLNTTTGAIVPSWKPSSIVKLGFVNAIVLSHGRLYVGGDFKTVGGAAHGGLVALRPTTGTVTPYIKFSVTGHHNFGTKCDPKTATCAGGRTGVKSLDVNAAGTRLVAIGDFTAVAGLPRDQVVMIRLGASSATVDAGWATLDYTAECLSQAFDSYVRQVRFSPTGSYFVVVAAGGIGTNRDGTDSSCDAAARFETNRTGSNLHPTWVDYTGEDSLWSVAITDTAVYVGGHARWMNNNLGQNAAGRGAIARPGVAALSPQNGLPFTWNPGRQPRGDGSRALLATSRGLWMGSDTNYVGDGTYFRAKIALFPLAGGERVPPNPTPRLPGRVYLAGATAAGAADPNRLVYREFDGVTAGQEEAVASGISWGQVHGAFTVGGKVIYGKSDGNLYERSFNGASFGAEVELDPFNDPTWDAVQTGSGQTYQSLPSTFAAQIPSVTSMFYTAGRLYYTLSGQQTMHWRWFEPESGVIGAVQFTAPGAATWSKVDGAFLAGSKLYYADATSGQLRSVSWSVTGGATGPSTLVDSSIDWASRGLFALSQTANPTPSPSAAFTSTCTDATCRFLAQSAVDPDGGVVKYAWNFGDGTSALKSTSLRSAHRFRTNGSHTVTLTVSDTAGASSSVKHVVKISAPIEKVAFVARSTAASTATTAHLVIPARAKKGNALVLFDSFASTKAKVTTPKGWKFVGRTRRNSLTTAVFDKVASAHDARRKVAVKYSRSVHSSLVLAVYRNTSSRPVEAHAVSLRLRSRTHLAPALRRLTAGSWVIGYWTQMSRRTSSWKLPHGLKRRATAHSRPGPADGAIAADLGKACKGTCRLGAARSQRLSRAAASWAVALQPALG
jgi:PKD repeat protein